MDNVFTISRRKKLFTLEEARDLLPMVRKITSNAHKDMESISFGLSCPLSSERKGQLEKQMQECFDRWQAKMLKLGCEVKGAWLVDFDNGEGYYCWRFPEEDIRYFHTYKEGFSGRTPLEH